MPSPDDVACADFCECCGDCLTCYGDGRRCWWCTPDSDDPGGCEHCCPPDD
jgi:hypothetical protein